MNGMFFQNWTNLVRVCAVGTISYIGLVLLLRVSGKRTLSKMNAFDLVVTVALGSTFATVLLSKEVALAEGLLAFTLLATLQFLVAWLTVRSPVVRRLVKADPRLLFYRGEFLEDGMRAERVNRDEVLAAVRARGLSRLDDIGSVVLETDGSMTVTEGWNLGISSALRDVQGVPLESQSKP